MKRIGLLVTLLMMGAITFAQTGKELEKTAEDAYDAKNYPKAFLNFTRAIKAYEKEGITDTAIYFNAAVAGFKGKKYEEFIPYATKAIELKHKKAHLAYYIKALAYKQTGNSEKYLETLKKGYKAFPNYTKLGKKLAIAYLKKGMEPYKAAGEIVEKAEPLRESNTEKYLKKIEKSNKKFEEARVIFEKAYEANPKEQQVLKLLLNVYQNLEMEKKAEKIQTELNALKG